MNVVHGGDWNLTFPYDSFPAFQKADGKGADAVKGDFRVSKDNIGMVMHSSPVEFWESLDCFKHLVEEHSAEENSACVMVTAPETEEVTFSTVPEVLAWADDTINVMFCVKETADIPRAITTLVENNATHRYMLLYQSLTQSITSSLMYSV
jgi:glycerophosphoryl diester phosphodiesterase